MAGVRAACAQAVRAAYPAVLAKVLRFTGSLPEAEDAVHDAAERALTAWERGGLPRSAEAWLVAVACNAHRDRRRRIRRADAHADVLGALAQSAASPDVPAVWSDELLRLVFACCHPALQDGESAALALTTLLGLSTEEVARAFVVAPRSMEQRLARARQRLRERGDVEGTTAEGGRERLGAVTRVVHLLYTEGHWSGSAEGAIRADLCRLALGLARSLRAVYPEEPEVAGLLALIQLHEARRDARLDGRGDPVPLTEQDRSRWDHEAIREASALLHDALQGGRPGPLQTEAAIAAVHCRAPSAAQTDWAEIAALYGLLERLRPTPAVRVNRAFAMGSADGAEAGLELLARADIDVGAYPYVHLVRGALLAELGRTDEALTELREASQVARNAVERRQIEARIAKLAD
jgi:RNA polymerase sigma-70 factor (ECF subfamily)